MALGSWLLGLGSGLSIAFLIVAWATHRLARRISETRAKAHEEYSALIAEAERKAELACISFQDRMARNTAMYMRHIRFVTVSMQAEVQDEVRDAAITALRTALDLTSEPTIVEDLWELLRWFEALSRPTDGSLH